MKMNIVKIVFLQKFSPVNIEYTQYKPETVQRKLYTR